MMFDVSRRERNKQTSEASTFLPNLFYSIRLSEPPLSLWKRQLLWRIVMTV